MAPDAPDKVVKAAEVLKDLVDTIVRHVRQSQRILFPGIAVALFLTHRYKAKVFYSPSQDVPSLFLSILIGTLVYFGYRSLVHPLAWFLQRRSGIGIPQQVLHQSVCHSEWTGPIATSVRFSQSCLDYFQKAKLARDERADTWTFNSGSHLLYMTAAIGLAFLAHDGYFLLTKTYATETPNWLPPSNLAALGWLVVFLIGFVGGLSYDRNADYREALILFRLFVEVSG